MVYARIVREVPDEGLDWVRRPGAVWPSGGIVVGGEAGRAQSGEPWGGCRSRGARQQQLLLKLSGPR